MSNATDRAKELNHIYSKFNYGWNQWDPGMHGLYPNEAFQLFRTFRFPIYMLADGYVVRVKFK